MLDPLVAVKGGGTRVEVSSYDDATGTETIVMRTGDVEGSAADAMTRAAYDNARKVAEYYRNSYGRDGFDGKGSATRVVLHATDPDNAFWYPDEKRIWLGDGKQYFAPLAYGLDVIAHEFTHGVVSSEVKLNYIGQEGALDESFADVMATGIDGNELIGEDVYTPNVAGDALRDMRRPEHYSHISKMPTWEDEPHKMGEIGSLAAIRTSDKIGNEAMRRIWYTALTDKLKSHTGFAGAMQATIAAAEKLYGAGSEAAAAVKAGWESVGVSAATPKDLAAGLAAQGSSFRDRLRTIAPTREALAGARSLAEQGAAQSGMRGIKASTAPALRAAGLLPPLHRH